VKGKYKKEKNNESLNCVIHILIQNCMDLFVHRKIKNHLRFNLYKSEGSQIYTQW